MRTLHVAAIAAALSLAGPAHGETAGTGAVGTRRTSPFACPESTVGFEFNRGQADPRARFLARPRGCVAFFTDTDAVFALPRSQERPRSPERRPVPNAQGVPTDLVRMRFLGSRATAPVPGPALPGRSSYFAGNDPSKWIVGVSSVAAIRSDDFLPGASLLWRGLTRGRIEYELTFRPGSSPADAVFAVEGASSVSVAPDGTLLVATPGGILRHSKPVAWQEEAGARRSVRAAFRLLGDGKVGFALDPIDPRLPLTIDPVVEWSTFLGGNDLDYIYAMTVDSQKRVHVGGTTSSTNFALSGPYSTSVPVSGYSQGFVTRFNSDGSLVDYSTYIGGNYSDEIYGLAVDSTGAIYATGSTYSNNFPITSGAIQVSMRGGGNRNMFATKIAASGTSLAYSTYLGGDNSNDGYAIVVDSSGEAVVAGVAGDDKVPVKNPVQATFGGNADVLLARLNSSGTALVYSTFFGGSANEYPYGVVLASDGSPIVAGYTTSTNYPTVNAYKSTMTGGDAFLFKLSSNGSSVAFSTCFGGSGFENAVGLGQDGDGSIFIAGFTSSTDLPTKSAYQTSYRGLGDAYMAKFKADGSGIIFSTYLGGSAQENPTCMATSRNGWAFVVGETKSTDFPTASPDQASPAGGDDAFVARIRGGNELGYSSYLGGSSDETVAEVAALSSGEVWVGGGTISSGFPTTTGAFDRTFSGYSEGFLWKGKFPAEPEMILAPPLGLTAGLAGLTTIGLLWTDTSTIETGFEIQRKTGSDPFTDIGTVGANTTSFLDPGLAPETTYTYRVRAVNGVDASGYSAEVSKATPATPDTPPDGNPANLQATMIHPRRVDLTWEDHASNEAFSLIARSVGAGLYATLATPILDVESYSDTTVLPEKTYSWMVKAQNNLGSSLFTAPVTLTMPSTMAVTVSKGKISTSDSIGRSSVYLAGTLEFLPEAEIMGFDPSLSGLSIRLGDIEATPILNLQAGEEGWKLRKGRWQWKSRKGSTSKATVVIDTNTGIWSLRRSKMTIPSIPGNPIRVTLGVGTDAGHVELDWAPLKKAGQFKYPVPEPD